MTASDYLAAMMAEIKARRELLRRLHPDGKNNLQIMIHIHGGMNLYKGAVQRAAHAYWIMEHPDEGHLPASYDPTIYPIFICWNSFPTGCYFDHVLYDRSGVSYRNSDLQPFTLLTAPLVLLGDLGAAIFRGPDIAAQQAFGDFRTVAPGIYPETRDYVPTFEEKKALLAENNTSKTGPDQKPTIHILQGRDTFSETDKTINLAKYILTLPAKGITGGLINSLGPGAWAEMKRRVDLMFWRQTQLLPYYTNPQPSDIKSVQELAWYQRNEQGGVARFLKALKEQVGTDNFTMNSEAAKKQISDLLETADKNKARLSLKDLNNLKSEISLVCNQNIGCSEGEYSVTLIGHSVGAIVINEMIKSDPEIAYKRIIYMAAACSLKDFQDTIIPYMQSNPDCKFYNLSLHPEAELRNIEMFDLVPRGGLLNWIDDIFESPADARHRVYGKFITAVDTSDIIPKEISDRVYFKAFGFGDSNQDGTRYQQGFPHNHGDFNHYDGSGNSAKENPNAFWTDDFYWYNASPDVKRDPNPLVYGDADPDKNPGSPEYLDRFSPEWTDADRHPLHFFAQAFTRPTSRSKP